MKVSYKWLKEYVDFKYAPEELAEKLTMAGLEVDGIEYQGEGIKDIIVGEIKEKKEHENADKLSVCKVDVGEELQIVCGAKNMDVGDKVPVAPIGTIMPNGMEIKKAKLRGVTSYGMMCSTNELNLPDDGVDGLFILSDDTVVGNKLIDELKLNDTIIELDLTPNFAHCLSMVGVAREIAAILDTDINYPKSEIEEVEENIEDWISIKVEDNVLAPRYAGRVITGIKVKESPYWLKRRLEAVGIRPINNVVDVTNYILMELGQPLHAFDYEAVVGNQIVVRRAKNGENLVTLDNERRELDEEMLVVCDDEKPLCIAGVMGGANSEVSKGTTTVFLEGANFNPGSIRRTARKVGLHSDSSHRFERGVDINLIEFVLDRAAALIAELGGGYVVEGMLDNYPKEVSEEIIELRPKRVRELLGVHLAKIKIKRLLERLHFSVEDKGIKLAVSVPTYRVDIDQEIDLVEEVARLYGYDQIDPITPSGDIIQGRKTKKQKVEDKTREVLSALGLFEAQNYSFISPEVFNKINLADDDKLREGVRLSNPLGEEYSVLRTTLITGLLDNIKLNFNRQMKDIRLFELGTTFVAKEDNKLPIEKLKLAAAIMKDNLFDKWNSKAAEFFYLKGVLEDYFSVLGIKNIRFIADEVKKYPFLHPGRSAQIKIDNQVVGYLGELHPDIQEVYDLDNRVALFELDFSSVVTATNFIKDYKQLPKHPALTRDMALVVKDQITSKDIEEVIIDVGGDLLETVELFDLYQGEQVTDGYKSLAYSLSYRKADETLTDDEVNKLQDKIEERLDDKFGAKIRE